MTRRCSAEGNLLIHTTTRSDTQPATNNDRGGMRQTHPSTYHRSRGEVHAETHCQSCPLPSRKRTVALVAQQLGQTKP